MIRKYLVIILSCLFLLAAGVCYSCSYNKECVQDVLVTSLESDNNNANPQDNMTEAAGKTGGYNSDCDGVRTDDPGLIYVHLCGAVANPDVYKIEAGSRLVDLIELAGGLNPDAAGDYINQAMVVEDGQRIYIPTEDELNELTLSEYMQGDQSSQSKDGEAQSMVNINTADESALMSLPGIGQTRAKSIIEYRTKNGGFSVIEDLMKVPGIKEGLFSRIADKITVGN